MFDISEEDWKQALYSILEQLSDEQYEKLLEMELTEVPQSQRACRVKMPKMIIEHYGLEKSISVIDVAMERIPRKDAQVQDRLRPFVEQLENHNKEKERQKRKRDTDEDTSLAAGEDKKKQKCDLVDEQKIQGADQQMSCTPDGKKKPQSKRASSLKRSIHDLKLSSEPVDKFVITGRVVGKSGLRMYRTKDNVKKPFFHIAVANEEDSVRMMVYGKERYKEIKEGGSYSFRRLIKDECSVKVTQLSVVAKTKSVQVPEKVETEAQKLIYSNSPFYSIDEARSADRTVSVEGTVSEINPVKDKRQDFNLTDQTGSIRIVMWRDQTKACKQLTVGDVVQVTNLKPTTNFNNVSLNSTGFTKIKKIQSIGVQKRKIEIEGVIKANKRTTQLDVMFDDEMHIFIINSSLLAKEFGLKLEGEWSESLLDNMPLWAEAEIHGNRIKKISAVQEM